MSIVASVLQSRVQWRLSAILASIEPVRLFVVLATLLGSCFALMLPPLQVPDEWSHFDRMYIVSTGNCASPSTVQIPADLAQLEIRFQAPLEDRAIARNLIHNLGTEIKRRPARRTYSVKATNISANLYSCAPYVGAAVAMAAVRTLGGGALLQLYAIRLTNLAIYVALVALAIGLTPMLRYATAAVALLPMSLQQAASASADAVTIAASFLFTALVLRLAFGPLPERRTVFGLIGTGAFLGLCKIPGALLLAPLIVPARRVGGWVRWLGLVVGTATLSLAMNTLWNQVNAAYSASFAKQVNSYNVSFPGNVQFFVHYPGLVLFAFEQTLVRNGAFYIASFVGVLASLTVQLGAWFVAAALVGIAFTAVVRDPAEPAPAPWQRGLAAGMGIVSILLIFFAFYFATASILDVIMNYTTGRGAFDGVQGRYFLPTAIVSLAAVSGLVSHAAVARWRGVSVAVLAIGGTLVSVFAVYHAEWLPAVLTEQGHPPRYIDGKALEGKIITTDAGVFAGSMQYVHGGRRYWITDGRWFARHHLDMRDAIRLDEDVFRHIPMNSPVIDDADADIDSPRAYYHANELVRVSNTPTVWAVRFGYRHQLEGDAVRFASAYPVKTVSQHDLNTLPIGLPVYFGHEYDGKVIRVSGDALGRLYVVQDGIVHWILDGTWFKRHGYGDDPKVLVLSEKQFERMREGLPLR